jgi:ABC-type transport system involved in multi-copper enzyme maturation permease subunit
VIFRHWLRENALLAVGYTILLSLNVIASVLYWPDLRDNVPAMIKLIPLQPLQDFFRAMDEYGFWAYLCFQLSWKAAGVFGIAAAGLMGTGIVARDVDNRTAELLLSRPISRASIFFQRWLAGAVLLVLPMFLVAAVAIQLAPRVQETAQPGVIYAATAYVALFVLAAYTLTTALSARFSHQLKAGIVVMGFMLLQFALYMIKGLWDYSLYNLIDLDPLIPIADGVFPWNHCLLMGGATLIFYGAAWWSFERRDF